MCGSTKLNQRPAVSERKRVGRGIGSGLARLPAKVKRTKATLRWRQGASFRRWANTFTKAFTKRGFTNVFQSLCRSKY